MSIDESTQPMSDAGGDARKARRARSEDDGSVGSAAKCFSSNNIRGVARLGEGLAGDGQQPRSG